MINEENDGIRLLAALNNAEWCDAVCRAHGLESSLGEGVWISPRRTPPYYPDAVTLSTETSEETVLTWIDTDAPGSSVKDSFAVLDLAPDGFEVLFDAQWIHRPAAAPAPAPSPLLDWTRVDSAAELEAWEAAWDGEESTGLFRPALLTSGIAFLAGRDPDGRIRAGAVANRTGEVVGLSNVFTADGTPDDAAWSGSLASIAGLWPGLAVVGYESGDDLGTAVRHGFRPVGPLRVWLRTG
ncbi:hypothetical protein [Streptomyces sp. NBC_00503]|uniref:hypothetical protein n=1 Tax=Streptomyces sp. NBC_00503 TaxID=2903659 RepID=UPI002E8067F1|nr:hypothetical protein [Streptomyces sp. NBC_00503]WUD84513.1 hypothetical protein OG490_30325 [Streptomyces sp. NBC_00503]